MMVAALIVALAAQKFNSYKANNTTLIKVAMVVLGLVLALPVYGLPTAPWGEPLFAWLDKSYLWALALPGVASLIGTAPGMKTDSK